MTQAEVDTVLNEVVPYWKGKTSHELYLNMLPRETRRVIYGDEEYATQGLIFDEANNAHTLSWTGSYEKVIREGLESIIRELEEKKAGIEGNLLHNQMDKIYYLDAAILSCKAMITYAHRYADRAEAMAARRATRYAGPSWRPSRRSAAMCPSTPPGTSMRRCRPSGSFRWATGWRT